MKVVRAGWTSGSFLVYAGALTALLAAVVWQSIIAAEHSKGDFAGWSVLFVAVAAWIALALRASGRRLVGGLFAFVAVGLWGVTVGAFFSWFGWLSHKNAPFSGFHWGDLGLEFLIVLAAIAAIRVFRFPLLVLIAAGVGWFFVTDLVSSGGSWSATVTLLVGLALFLYGLGLRGDRRPYGFWVHVVAGLTVGGALLWWLHTSDADWVWISVFALAFVLVGAAARRSSYAVLGAVGFALATGHFSAGSALLGATQLQPAPVLGQAGASSGSSSWQIPVAYICLGVFLVLLGMLLHRRNETASPT